MCLAIPGEVKDIETTQGVRMGTVSFGGITKRVCLQYATEANVGDFVLVHVGFAISIIDREEAARTYKILEELRQLNELEVGETDGSPEKSEGKK